MTIQRESSMKKSLQNLESLHVGGKKVLLKI